MKFKTFTLILMLCVTVLLIQSCKKDAVKGCTDPNSITYNKSATVDDGSCQYSGNLVIWWNEAFYDTCYTDNVTQINITIGNTLIGTVYPATGYPTIECNASGTLTAKVNFGSDKSYHVSVKSDYYVNGYYAFSVNQEAAMVANICNFYQLQ